MSRPAPLLSAVESGAFVPGACCRVAPTATGSLDGLRFAVKDLIDVAGYLTGGGNPHWLADQQLATAHASAVSTLLAAGAELRGKTITDELAFSLEGANWHYGTPANPRFPDYLPGGSSSGSAAAVAAGLVDFALGTDTGGSVRIPAAFCGIYGMRPTHDAIALDGVVPFSPSYDTIGWLAPSPELLAAVGNVLLPGAADSAATPTLARVSDAYALCEPELAAYLQSATDALLATQALEVFNGDWPAWLRCYQVLQGIEIRDSLGPWIARTTPLFGPEIAPRFAGLADISAEQVTEENLRRLALRKQLDQLLANNQVLIIPTSPTPGLARSATGDERGDFYARSLSINAIAGHAGLPQISVPLLPLGGKPAALSFIAARGSDRLLLRHLPLWCRLLQDQGFMAPHSPRD